MKLIHWNQFINERHHKSWCIEPESLILCLFQVIFHYVGYNETGRRIDSTYLQGTPAKIRMGTKGLVPGEASEKFWTQRQHEFVSNIMF